MNRFYYINNDTSLILYARRQTPFSGFLPLGKVRNNFIDIDTDNINEVGSEFEYMLDSLNSTLKYPISTGTEWTFASTTITTIKKYIGFENVSVPAGTISCMKINVILSYLQSTDRVYYYYSKFGLMKGYLSFNDLTVTTVTSPDGIGTIDQTTETVVSSYSITSD